MFSILTGGSGEGSNLGGMTFENLTFHYPAIDMTEGIPSYAAIHTVPDGGARNVNIVRCVFDDCPIGVWFESALECCMLESLAEYSSNAGIAVKLGDGENEGDSSSAKEIFLTDCEFEGSAVYPGVTAIMILGSEHVRVSNCQIDDCYNGILIVPKYGKNALRHMFTAVAIYTGEIAGATSPGYGLLIQPQISDAAIGHIVLTDCSFELGDSAVPTATSPGILVDATVGTIDTVELTRFRGEVVFGHQAA
jgi:hypothetical protein